MHNTGLYWDGQKINIVKREELVAYLETFGAGNWFSIVVTPVGTVNNTEQSKLYHKWCDLIARELGWDSGDEIHAEFKKRFNNSKSTKGFDTKQWSEYMTKVLAFAGEYNIKLPTGNS